MVGYAKHRGEADEVEEGEGHGGRVLEPRGLELPPAVGYALGLGAEPSASVYAGVLGKLIEGALLLDRAR